MKDVVLDSTPTGKEEYEDEFSDPADHRKRLENHSLRQDIRERKTFASRAFYITITWVAFLVLLTAAQFLLRKFGYGLTEIEFNIVFSTTTGSVLVFWYLVGKYLFNSPNKISN